MSAPHGLQFDGSRFWVMHRHQEYGPFDYQWSVDLRGLEMTYRGEKFGEHCSENQIYADLKEFRLPQSVVEVSSIVLGCTLYGIVHALSDEERRTFLVDRLCEHGYEKFAESCRENDAAWTRRTCLRRRQRRAAPPQLEPLKLRAVNCSRENVNRSLMRKRRTDRCNTVPRLRFRLLSARSQTDCATS